MTPVNTRRYYYNYNLPQLVSGGGWQVICEYDGSDTYKLWYAYGNYIDEVLIMGISHTPILTKLYIHDHLYSPVALTDYDGTVIERYEYDAYGNPTIWNADFSTERETSAYYNPYLFTGRRVDILDSGSLKIQYNRNRYYDYYTGRWLTNDPLGITPNCRKPNRFKAINQYRDSMNLYQYAASNPAGAADPWDLQAPISIGIGLPSPSPKQCGICGPDVTDALGKLRTAMIWYFNDSSLSHRFGMCWGIFGAHSWDIHELKHMGGPYGTSNCGCGDCGGTVTVKGKCYDAAEVNYWMWGVMVDLCTGPDFISALEGIGIAVGWSFVGKLLWPEKSWLAKGMWAWAGYKGDISLAIGSKSYCKTSCDETVTTLTAKIKTGGPIISSFPIDAPFDVEIPSDYTGDGYSGSW